MDKFATIDALVTQHLGVSFPTAQIVIRQNARSAPLVQWSFSRSAGGVAATTARRSAQREPELPL